MTPTNYPKVHPNRYPEGTLLVVTGGRDDPCLVRVTGYHASDAALYTLQLTSPSAGDMRIFGDKPLRTALTPLSLDDGLHLSLASEAVMRHVDEDAERAIVALMSAAGLAPLHDPEVWPVLWPAGTLVVLAPRDGSKTLCTVWDRQRSQGAVCLLALHGEFAGQLLRYVLSSGSGSGSSGSLSAWHAETQGHTDLAAAVLDAPVESTRLRQTLLDALRNTDYAEVCLSAARRRAALRETPPANPPAPGMSEVVQALRDAETERAAAEDRMHDALQTRARRLMFDLQALQPHYPRPIAVTVTPRDFTISFGKDE